jgi:hypothetical protein
MTHLVARLASTGTLNGVWRPARKGDASIKLTGIYLAVYRPAAVCPAAVTLQTVLPTSSAISKAPVLSIATPTGRPRASPLAFKNPVTTSSALPCGRPPLNGTNTTL